METSPEESRDTYTGIWESEEEELGRQDFADLFAHIRMVYAKTKARETILAGFREAVLKQEPDPRAFINHVLVPYAHAFQAASRAAYQEESGGNEINNLLEWLNQLDNTDWIPPAISYISRHGGDPAQVLTFVRDLDRLAASMHIRRLDVTQRIDRYGRVLDEIEKCKDLTAAPSALQLTDAERSQTADLLNGEIYTVTRLRLYVMLRLDSTLSSGGANYDHPLITVEHVLPQHPNTGSKWRLDFTDDQHAYWVHRLANLVLLTRRKNSEAGIRDFDEKKRGYFTGRSGTSPFPLTSQVIHATSWTPDILEERQATLVDHLRTLWRL